MAPSPDPLADWFSPLPSAIGLEDLFERTEVQAAAGVRALESQLGAASSMHGAAEWLAAAAVGAEGQALAGAMVAATITADHFQARLVCPQSYGRRLRRRAWRTYAARRAAQALDKLSDVFLRWSVLECIPANWVVKEAVFAQMSARLEEAGYEGIAIEGDIAVPFPGGADWLRRECAAECDDLQKGRAGAIRAAVLFWPGRVLPAIVATQAGKCTAYAPGLDRDGLEIEWLGGSGVSGVLLLPVPESPPVSLPMVFWRSVGLGRQMWGIARKWRAWRGSR
jgi:hypothetical protein